MTLKNVYEFDFHKLNYHPCRVSKWLNKEAIYPIFVEIAPTAACNYRCIFCAFDYVPKSNKFLNEQKYYSLIEEFTKLGIKSIMLAGEGEPLLHKKICQLISFTKQKNIDISITTNGSLLHTIDLDNFLRYLSWIRISLNAASETSFAKIHKIQGKVLHQVLNNLKNIVEHKKKNNLKTTIGIQFLLIEDNEHEVEEIAKIGKDLGVDYLSIKPYSHHPKSVNDFQINYQNLKIKEKIMKHATENYKVIYRENAMNYLDNEKKYCKCNGLDFFSLIDAVGNVIPCNLFFTGTDEYSYGNIFEKSFEEIWNGEKRKKIINQINEKLKKQCRLGCRLDSINQYLERLLNPKEHDNFI